MSDMNPTSKQGRDLIVSVLRYEQKQLTRRMSKMRRSDPSVRRVNERIVESLARVVEVYEYEIQSLTDQASVEATGEETKGCAVPRCQQRACVTDYCVEHTENDDLTTEATGEEETNDE